MKLGATSDPARRHFEGWIEEVDTGRELRFRSTEELLDFLADCFEKARQRMKEPDDVTSE